MYRRLKMVFFVCVVSKGERILFKRGGASQRIPITAENESWKDILKMAWGSIVRMTKAANARVDQTSFSRRKIRDQRNMRAIVMARWPDI